MRWRGSNLGGVVDEELRGDIDCNHGMQSIQSEQFCWREKGRTWMESLAVRHAKERKMVEN